MIFGFLWLWKEFEAKNYEVLLNRTLCWKLLFWRFLHI